jgi:riboflavin kinase / FMN adenylyltransferase
MQILKSTRRDSCSPFTNACVTIGNFDGVHYGHQQLFRTVVQKARCGKGDELSLPSIRTPSGSSPWWNQADIDHVNRKIELIDMAGIDVLVIIPSTARFAKTTAEQFVQPILLDTIGVTELVVGYDYAFGKGRSGNIAFLHGTGRLFRDFRLPSVILFYEKGMLVSSTRIRELVKAGGDDSSRKLLGRHISDSRYGPGRQAARWQGDRFSNRQPEIQRGRSGPRNIGVYATQVICDGTCYGGILNIGYNPTFGEGRLVAETHIFDFNKDIYGKPIKVNLLKFLRSERKFSGDQRVGRADRPRRCPEARQNNPGSRPPERLSLNLLRRGNRIERVTGRIAMGLVFLVESNWQVSIVYAAKRCANTTGCP